MRRHCQSVRERAPKFGPILCVAAILSGCVADSYRDAPSAPDQAWHPKDSTGASSDFSVPANPEVAGSSREVKVNATYGLAELIDLAQKNHPSTRVAWERARQAALSVGMVEATFLPVLTGNVIGGWSEVVTPVPDIEGGTFDLTTTVKGATPNLALQWLVFDFGQRQAWRDAAKQNAFAANVGFNGTHQALIYGVTQAYYRYDLAQTNVKIADQAVRNSREVMAAAESRFKNGTGTKIEVAQANQLAAQARLRRVQAVDARRDAYHELIGAVGISPRSEIRIVSVADRRLPRASALPTDKLIETALARRPDVLASYAAVKASEANERAATAEFLPKVYLSGIAASNQTGFQVGNLPEVGVQTGSTGVFVGVSIPLYDGGLRSASRKRAQSVTASAQASFEQTRNTAMREIVIASDNLRSSLEAYAAATELRAAASLTFDAAFDAFRNGLGTITDVTLADSGLLDARQAQAEAHAASLVAAASLAFSLGAMTSSTSPLTTVR
ncbi:TolC family protein [Labrenzia sp. 011]|uniref:TolC family protein n=1 Tax=Labrenzia sp. 011 TaxID=2171494 RepID=UPI000D511CBC|nr:TolC family protein [Labrenzia sp. 011]PVB60470.1 TolC family protein [Labrenzia sp. 011]